MSLLRAFALSILVFAAPGCDDTSVLQDAAVPGDAGTVDGSPGSPDAGTTAPDAGPPPPSPCPGAALCGDTDIIVDADWLAMHLGDADLQVLDVRSEAEFTASRIQGALRIDSGALRTSST